MKKKIYCLIFSCFFIITSTCVPKSNLNNELLKAVYLNDLKRVKSLIRRGADIESKKNKTGWTPLMIAVMTGKYEMVQFLLNKGAIIDSKDNSGLTALFHAVQYDRSRIVILLIEKGADIKSKNIYNQTPLYYASKYNRLEIAKLLIEKGADVNINFDGFKDAAQYGYIEIVKLMLNKIDNVNTRNTYGTVLDYAYLGEQEEVIKILLEAGVKKGIEISYSKDKYNRVHIGMSNNEFLDIFNYEDKNGVITSSEWKIKENIYGLEGSWYFNFEKSKLEWFSYSFNTDDVSRENYKKCLYAAKKLINEYTKKYGKPAEYLEKDIKYIDPLNWNAEPGWNGIIIEGKWINDNMKFKIYYDFTSWKEYFFSVGMKFFDKDYPYFN